MDLANIAALVGVAGSVLYQVLAFGAWRGKMELRLDQSQADMERFRLEAQKRAEDQAEERKEIREALRGATEELRRLREELHAQSVANLDGFVRRDAFADSMNRLENRLAEVWRAIDDLRERKQNREDCVLKHSHQGTHL